MASVQCHPCEQAKHQEIHSTTYIKKTSSHQDACHTNKHTNTHQNNDHSLGYKIKDMANKVFNHDNDHNKNNGNHCAPNHIQKPNGNHCAPNHIQKPAANHCAPNHVQKPNGNHCAPNHVQKPAGNGGNCMPKMREHMKIKKKKSRAEKYDSCSSDDSSSGDESDNERC